MLSDLCINIILRANPAVLWHCIAVGPQTDGVSAYSSQGFWLVFNKGELDSVWKLTIDYQGVKKHTI